MYNIYANHYKIDGEDFVAVSILLHTAPVTEGACSTLIIGSADSFDEAVSKAREYLAEAAHNGMQELKKMF